MIDWLNVRYVVLGKLFWQSAENFFDKVLKNSLSSSADGLTKVINIILFKKDLCQQVKM